MFTIRSNISVNTLIWILRLTDFIWALGVFGKNTLLYIKGEFRGLEVVICWPHLIISSPWNMSFPQQCSFRPRADPCHHNNLYKYHCNSITKIEKNYWSLKGKYFFSLKFLTCIFTQNTTTHTHKGLKDMQMQRDGWEWRAATQNSRSSSGFGKLLNSLERWIGASRATSPPSLVWSIMDLNQPPYGSIFLQTELLPLQRSQRVRQIQKLCSESSHIWGICRGSAQPECNGWASPWVNDLLDHVLPCQLSKPMYKIALCEM